MTQSYRSTPATKVNHINNLALLSPILKTYPYSTAEDGLLEATVDPLKPHIPNPLATWDLELNG